MDGLILLRPFWLAALAPLAGLVALVMLRAPDAGGWQAVMPRDMLRAMQALGALTGRQPVWQRLLAPAGLLALILGLAGPAVPRDDAPVLAQTDAVVLAMDLSPSVAQGRALNEAKFAAAGLAQGLAGRPVGLVLYGGEGFTASAPTLDVGTLQTQIGVLDGETMPGEGTRVAAALVQAGRMLDGLRRADLIVITDGGGIDAAARAEADRLAERGVRISAVRVEGVAEGAVPAPPEALAGLVRGGEVVNPSDLPRLVARLDRGGDTVRDPLLRSLQYRDFGPFLAALAGLPLLLMLRRQR